MSAHRSALAILAALATAPHDNSPALSHAQFASRPRAPTHTPGGFARARLAPRPKHTASETLSRVDAKQDGHGAPLDETPSKRRDGDATPLDEPTPTERPPAPLSVTRPMPPKTLSSMDAKQDGQAPTPTSAREASGRMHAQIKLHPPPLTPGRLGDRLFLQPGISPPAGSTRSPRA